VADTSRLLEEAASEANLAQALLNVVRNKGAPGVDGQTVETAEAPSIIARLRRDLLSECYRPGDVRRVWLPKPGGGQRGLGISNVVDRMVQQAVLQVLEPVFEPTFHASSHGFRPKRGAHTAIAEATGYLKDGYQTVVDLDLASFFRPGSSSTPVGPDRRSRDGPTDGHPHTPDAEGGGGDAGRNKSRRPGRNAARRPALAVAVQSCLTNQMANSRDVGCGSFDTPTIVIFSCGANAPVSAS
jgi:hypothetical protein